MTLDALNKLIDDALSDLARGQLLNATTLSGNAQEERLREDFDMLIALERTAKKIAAEKFKL